MEGNSMKIDFKLVGGMSVKEVKDSITLDNVMLTEYKTINIYKKEDLDKKESEIQGNVVCYSFSDIALKDDFVIENNKDYEIEIVELKLMDSQRDALAGSGFLSVNGNDVENLENYCWGGNDPYRTISLLTKSEVGQVKEVVKDNTTTTGDNTLTNDNTTTTNNNTVEKEVVDTTGPNNNMSINYQYIYLSIIVVLLVCIVVLMIKNINLKKNK